MRVFVALMIDAWRELCDKRVVWGLGLLSAALVAFFAGISFSPVDADAALRRATQSLHQMQRTVGLFGRLSEGHASGTYHASQPRAAVAEDDFPLGASLRVVELDFEERAAADDLCRAWQRFKARPFGMGTRSAPGGIVSPERDSTVTRGERIDWLTERLRGAGFDPVYAREQDDGGSWLRFVVAAGAEQPLELRGGASARLFFGATTVALADSSPAEFLATLDLLLAERFSGLLGVLLLLGALSSSLPDLLQKGRLDLVLARPVGRTQLVVGRYLGSVAFVLLFWSIVFAACVVAVGAATGCWSPGLLGCALTSTLVFAAVHPVGMFVGALTRHSSLASLAALFAWALQGIVLALRDFLASGVVDGAARWQKLVDGVYWLLPKCSDLVALNQELLARERLSPELAAMLFPPTPPIDWWFAGGTTALFAAAFVALAAWWVARRDW